MRSRIALGLFFVGAGIMHFVKPRAYKAIVPDALPAHSEIVMRQRRRGDRRRARAARPTAPPAGRAGG